MSFFLAGLASGLGKGMVEQAQFNLQRDEAQRDRDFQMALENLRSENDRTNAGVTADLNDRNTQREYGYKDAFEERDLPRKVKLAQEEGAIRKDVDNNATGNEIRLAQVRGAIERQNDAASLKLRDQIESGQVVDTLLDENGEYVGITRTGKQVRTGVYGHTVDTTFRPTANGYGGSALFPELGPQGLAAPVAAPAPAPAQAAPRQQAAPAKAPAQSGEKVMTQADINATAKARNITPAAAKMLLEELGYRLKS